MTDGAEPVAPVEQEPVEVEQDTESETLKWKARARDWESRSKLNNKENALLKTQKAELEAKVAAFEDERMTEAERQAREVEQARSELAKLRSQTFAYETATDHGLPKGDAELFLMDPDDEAGREDVIARRAERLAEILSQSPDKRVPRPVMTQGSTQGIDPGREALRVLGFTT